MKVLVLAAERLPLGCVGCYGSDWVETPALDRLAAEGVVFDQYYADRPDAAGARRAWRTGRYHLPAADPADEPAAPDEPDLLKLLRGRGVRTWLVAGPDRHGFEAGWERDSTVTAAAGSASLEEALEAADGAVEELGPRDDWLLWVELTALLPPWDVPAEFTERYFPPRGSEAGAEPPGPLNDLPVGRWDGRDDAAAVRLQDSYAAAVAYLDSGIGWLCERLRDRGWLDELLLVVTSDRGLALGEHGIVGDYRPWLHDELIHVPLIVRLPGAAEAGRRVFALTQSVDLCPTLLDAFGLPQEATHGHSLLPLARGAADPPRAYACAGHRIGAAVEWALRTPEWGFVLPVQGEPGDPPRGPQLYVKPDDRWEVNNVIQHHLELAEHLEQTLRGFVAATRQPGPLHAPELRDVEAELQAESTTTPMQRE